MSVSEGGENRVCSRDEFSLKTRDIATEQNASILRRNALKKSEFRR